jgi:Zn-dependent peptidase ImmA (M78 family)/transcriptional regulator with XRE-family HTH domain
MYNPERVELVRLRLGLTKIGFAERLGVDRKTIQRFENGDAELSKEAQDRLLSLSRYPKAFFEKTTAPEYPASEGISFRSLRSLTASVRYSTVAAGALAFDFDDWITERYNLPDHALVPDRISVNSPAAAALQVRVAWGIGTRPISNMINLLESRGVRVFSLVHETRHLDAYSLWRNNRPYIFLNTVKTAERSRFDSAHELGHLVLHRHTGSTHPRAESEADAFASAFLMPEDDLVAELPRVLSLQQLIEKKTRWGVSAAALAYTLNKLGRISDWHYRGYCIELGKIGGDVERNPMPRETSQVWTKILTDLWRRGMPLARVAQELSIPERELNDLLFGIATSIEAPNGARGPQAV